MSERETWLEWSDLVGRYSVHQDKPTCVAEILAANKAKWFQATDWRPIRIPPPAEIEALERDREALSRVLEAIDDTSNSLNSQHRQFLRGLILADSAMKGGEA